MEPEGRLEGAEHGDDVGGDPACWAHLVCPSCGAVETEGHDLVCSAELVQLPG
ncbi:MAG: hypothetical protein M0032_01575 [Actinomycetota bacterium]|nr:hypothetical protein [Actinomycetota bacterium]